MYRIIIWGLIMNKISCAILSIGLMAITISPNIVIAKPQNNIVSTAQRPDADKARDNERKPSEMVRFANIRSGQIVVDFIPGGGYFTRVFSDAVGNNGMVFAITPRASILRRLASGRTLSPPVSGEAGRTNVFEILSEPSNLNAPLAPDVVWTSQNYHDIRIFDGEIGTSNLNKAIFNALKPGGYYIVLDHSGATNLDDAGMRRLHRIDEDLVIREVEAAGFRLVEKSQILRNANDDRSLNVTDPTIRGKTDQFILKFQKPRR